MDPNDSLNALLSQSFSSSSPQKSSLGKRELEQEASDTSTFKKAKFPPLPNEINAESTNLLNSLQFQVSFLFTC